MAKITGDLSMEKLYGMEVTWKIHHSSRIPANVDSRLKSPSFSSAKANWRLVLHPNGCASDHTEGYIDIYLYRLNFSVRKQTVKVTFSIENRDGENCESYSVDNSYDEIIDYGGVTHFMARSKLKKNESFFLPYDTLTVHCRIVVESSPDYSASLSEDELLETHFSMERFDTMASPCEKQDASSQTQTPDTYKVAEDLQRLFPSIYKLQSDYKKLLETEEEADVRLKVSDKEFRAHKCILRARSSVLSAMFNHDMEEKNSGEVIIEDLDSESFPDFLQHMYSGSVNTLTGENVFNLYMAADKYEIADLKSECKSYMERTLSVDTFCDVMITALRYKEDKLLKAAVDFFSKNLTKIIVTVKWQKFLKEYDTAANELFIKALVPADQK